MLVWLIVIQEWEGEISVLIKVALIQHQKVLVFFLEEVEDLNEEHGEEGNEL